MLCAGLAEEQVVRDDVCCEGDNCDAEAGEHPLQHGTVLEDGVLSPHLSLCPRVAKEGWAGRAARHLDW